MQSFILLSLSPLIGLFILCAFCGVSVIIARKNKSIINASPVLEESAARKNDNTYSRPTRMFIPNVLASWPWPRQINPNYAVIKKDADAWITSFQAFDPKAQDAYNRCDFSNCFSSYSVRN